MQHDRSGRFDPTDQLGDDFDLVIIDQFLQVVGQDTGWQIDISSLFEVSHHDMLEPQRAASIFSGTITFIQQQLGNAGTDITQSDDRDVRFVHA